MTAAAGSCRTGTTARRIGPTALRYPSPWSGESTRGTTNRKGSMPQILCAGMNSAPRETSNPHDPRADRDYWSGRPVLLTGASGFVGSHLVSALLTSGAEVG